MSIPKPPVHRLILLQSLTTVLFAVLMLGRDTVAAYSALLGGLIQIGPQSWFNRFAFRHVGARETPRALRAIYSGESVKFLLTAVLFGLTAACVKPLQPLVMLLAYAAMVVVHLAGVAWALKQHNRK